MKDSVYQFSIYPVEWNDEGVADRYKLVRSDENGKPQGFARRYLAGCLI